MKVIDQAVLHILSDLWINFIDQTIEKYMRMIIFQWNHHMWNVGM